MRPSRPTLVCAHLSPNPSSATDLSCHFDKVIGGMPMRRDCSLSHPASFDLAAMAKKSSEGVMAPTAVWAKCIYVPEVWRGGGGLV